MLDKLYEDIGAQIKNWAKVIFVFEAIGAIITGFILMASDLMGYGLLALIGGPSIAFMLSGILYAFGQFVEDVHVIRDKEENLEKNAAKTENIDKDLQESAEEPKINLRKSVQCECGELYYGLHCPICGKSSKTQNASQSSSVYIPESEPNETVKKSHVCKCGERFYGKTCPNCGRTLKDLQA